MSWYEFDLYSERAAEAPETAKASEITKRKTVEGLPFRILAFLSLLGSLARTGYGVGIAGTVDPHGVVALRDAVEARADAGARAVVGDDVGTWPDEPAALDGEVLGEVGFVAPLAVAAELLEVGELVENFLVVAAEDDVAGLAELVVADGVVGGQHIDGGAGEEAAVDALLCGLCVQLKACHEEYEKEEGVFHALLCFFE